jgi:hypothetical protein
VFCETAAWEFVESSAWRIFRQVPNKPLFLKEKMAYLVGGAILYHNILCCQEKKFEALKRPNY